MMQVDAYLVELLTQGVPYETLVDYYEYDDEEIENVILYLHTTPPQAVYEMLLDAWFLRECDANELCY